MSNEWDDETLGKFLKDRRQALLSMDKRRILEFFRRWNAPEEYEHFKTVNSWVFWAAVHKAIVDSADLPAPFRKRSQNWLLKNGSRPFHG